MLKRILSAITALLIVTGAGIYAPKVQHGNILPAANAADYTRGKYESLAYVKYTDHVIITNCDNSTKGEVVIPAEIEELPVTKINETAFSRCSELSGVFIPNSVTEIGDAAFSECPGLTEVTIPESVLSIGDQAFAGCEGLKKITILNHDCEIYNTMHTITNTPFGSKEARYDGVICGFINSTAMSYALKWGYEFEVMTEEFTEGKYGALTYREYYDRVVISDCDKSAEGVIEIPAKINGLPVTEIGDNAFLTCQSITGVTIPDSVEYIGDSAFMFCSALTSVKMSDRIRSIGENAFGMTSITTIDLPESLTSIGDGAFMYSKLESVNVPDSVTDLGRWVFTECLGLKSVTLPDSIKSIRDSMFMNCPSLLSVTLPDSVTEIEEYAFFGCTRMAEVTIPESVEIIGERAFFCCDSMKKITILNPECEIYDSPDTISTNYDDVDEEDGTAWQNYYYNGVIAGHENSTAQAYAEKYGYTFEPLGREPAEKTHDDLIYKEYDDHIVIVGCVPSSEQVGIPPEIDGLPVTEIGSFAFAGCSELTYIIIPDTVTAIGDNAFFECTGLKEIKIPDGVTKIEDYTFGDCFNLTDIIIPDGVTSIGRYAFSACSSLERVTVPKSVTLIDKGAFYNCRDLKEITIFNPECVIYDYSATIANENAMDWDGTYNGIIRGYERSTAEAYAEKYGYTFESMGMAPVDEILYGDANCDGVVTIADATAIYQHLGNRDKYELTEQGKINADCAKVGDGITPADAIAVQRLDAGIIEELPVK